MAKQIMEEYPEIDELSKMIGVKDKSQAQGEFIEWLGERGIILAEWNEHGSELDQVTTSLNELLARFHGIDYHQAELQRMNLVRHVTRQAREVTPVGMDDQ